jgi:TonB family protein
MLPRPMSRSEPSAGDSDPLTLSDLTRLLEQHVLAGFPPDLALDLVLNELVVRAADATHASAAALALVRGDEMVCRAATGLHAPDLGIPLNTRDGLSGACVRTRAPQLSADTESDPRVDAAISRRLGIRSMLIVPVFDTTLEPLSNDALPSSQTGQYTGNVTAIRDPQLAGVLEVFSQLPDAFSQSDQTLLEEFARECARIRHAAAHLQAHPPAEVATPAIIEPEIIGPDEDLILSDTELARPASIADDSRPAVVRFRQPYEGWTLVLGALVILAAAAVSFMIGSRIGWLRAPQPAASSAPVSAVSEELSPPAAPEQSAPPPKSAVKSTGNARSSSDELVVYEKGKVIFRMKPAHESADVHGAAPVVPASPTSRPAHPVWLAPAQAESRLLTRVEPDYPADALAAHRAGNVVLEVYVAEDGTVSSVRPVSGDPLLAAAATQAVRNWRYQPFRAQDRASSFQTEVTLTFSLPN